MNALTYNDVNKYQQWMSCPKVDTDFPGLAYICPLDQLIVAEKCDALHKIIGKHDVSYTIFNSLGEKVFLAVQERRFQKFELKIFNFYGNEVIHVKKPFKCCVQRAYVWAPPDNFVGSVEKVGCVYLVRNNLGESVLKIKTKGKINFVYDIVDDKEVGVVKWQMTVLDVKNFGVAFPMDMEVWEKTVLLGACFVIGYVKYR